MPTNKDIVFGVHSVAILDRSNGYRPYTDGVLEVVGKVNMNFSVENINLMGGSNPFPFAVESGAASAEIAMTVRQMNRGMMTAMANAVTTAISTATGTVGAAKNTKGTSIVAATGITTPSVLTGSEADLKTGVYIIRAMSATTVNVYGTTNIDFVSNGTDVDFQDSDMKLIASNLTVTTGGDVTVTGFGMKLTGGAGTIAFTTDDCAIFEVVASHTGIKQYSVGTVGSSQPDVGLYFIGQKQADGSNFTVFVPKVKFSGLPLNFTEKAFSEFELTGTAVRTTDPFVANQEIVYRANYIKGASA